MRQLGSLQRSSRPSSWIRGGEGIRREGNWERKEGKGKGGEGRDGREWNEGRGEEEGGERDPTKFREKLTPLFTDEYYVEADTQYDTQFVSFEISMTSFRTESLAGQVTANLS